MKPFAVARPKTASELHALLSERARLKGGGYDLLDLAKRGVSTPDVMVDLSRVFGPESAAGKIGRPAQGAGLLIGARVTLAQIATSREVLAEFPALAEAAAEAATPQVRNVATLAGNLLQRPRCAYFRDPFFDCLKRGGKTCPAKDGVHDEAAIFGNGLCCATHPSNLAVTLVAARAELDVEVGVDADLRLKWRSIPVGEGFFLRPEEDPSREAALSANEILFQVTVPPAPASAYVEVNQKQSYDWAAASCAAVLDVKDGKIAKASIVLGAVAPIPWRLPSVENTIVGMKLDDPGIARIAATRARIENSGATPLRDNAWKVRLVPVVVRRALEKALERAGRAK